MRYNSEIESIGVKLPEKKLSSGEILKQIKVKKIRLELFTGIRERSICSPSENAITLAVDSISDCFKYSDLDRSDIDMLLCCSISRFGEDNKFIHEPSLSSEIAFRTGITNALNFDISNACAGMMTGLQIASEFIKNGTVKNCLVVSGEHISSICYNAIPNINSLSSPELASLTVGDAGAAVIIKESSDQKYSFESIKFSTLSKYSNLCNGKLSKKSHGAYMKTQMKKIHDISIRESIDILKKSLQESKLKIYDINYLIPHQTSKNAIHEGSKIYEKIFNDKPREVVINLKHTGNTASTTHFVALYKYLKEGRLKKEDRILLLSFASGLEIGIAIFRVNSIIERYGINN